MIEGNTYALESFHRLRIKSLVKLRVHYSFINYLNVRNYGFITQKNEVMGPMFINHLKLENFMHGSRDELYNDPPYYEK